MIEAVIFDVDGVLVDSEPLHLDATNRVLAKYDKQLSAEDNTAYLGMDELSYWKALIERFDLDADPEALGRERITLALVLIREGILSLPGVAECITGLLMRGLRLAAASSSSREVVDAILQELGLKASFQTVICGDEVACGKPDPEIFLKAAQGLGIAPDRCLVIEDAPHGLTAAHAAGMPAVAVLNRYNQDLDLSRALQVFNGLQRFDWDLLEGR